MFKTDWHGVLSQTSKQGKFQRYQLDNEYTQGWEGAAAGRF
jgi:hypothetical protein